MTTRITSSPTPISWRGPHETCGNEPQARRHCANCLVRHPKISRNQPTTHRRMYWPCVADGSRRKKAADRAAWEQRRLTSLQTCHRYSLYERPRAAPPKDSGAYVPELAARLDDDPNLTDGARRCARKLAEYTYRHARAHRSSEITVTWLMRALGKCRRTVQRYLGLLEREGYIRVDVIQSQTTRMCAGLLVHLLRPLFPQHHKDKWPRTLANPDATAESHKKNLIKYKGQRGPAIPCQLWLSGTWTAFSAP